VVFALLSMSATSLAVPTLALSNEARDVIHSESTHLQKRGFFGSLGSGLALGAGFGLASGFISNMFSSHSASEQQEQQQQQQQQGNQGQQYNSQCTQENVNDAAAECKNFPGQSCSINMKTCALELGS
jgi:hypothetical protein